MVGGVVGGEGGEGPSATERHLPTPQGWVGAALLLSKGVRKGLLGVSGAGIPGDPCASTVHCTVGEIMEGSK